MKILPQKPFLKRSTAVKAGLLVSMYMCQTLSLGYVFGSLPVIMRQQNMPLKSIGALFILHLPWAFKFLYASWVDRLYIPAVGRRRSWIFPLQWIGAVILLFLSQTPPGTHFTAMCLLVFLLHIVMATNDIAVDGYATDILHPNERPWGNTIQAGARFAGLMLGGGLMLFLHASLGWRILCFILAGTVFLLSLPVVFHREIPSIEEPCRTHDTPSFGILPFLKRREVRWLLPVLILPTTFAFTSFQMRMPLFTDLGLSTRDLGAVLMNWAYPAGLVGTALSGWLLHRTGVQTFLRFFCAAALLLTAYTILCATQGGIGLRQASIVLSVDNVLMGGIQVWAYTQMMRVSAGRQAGTGFAVLSSLFIIFPLATAPVFGAAGDRFGFIALYTILGIFMLGGFLAAEFTLYSKPTICPQDTKTIKKIGLI
jgi:MFS family permease